MAIGHHVPFSAAAQAFYGQSYPMPVHFVGEATVFSRHVTTWDSQTEQAPHSLLCEFRVPPLRPQTYLPLPTRFALLLGFPFAPWVCRTSPSALVRNCIGYTPGIIYPTISSPFCSFQQPPGLIRVFRPSRTGYEINFYATWISPSPIDLSPSIRRREAHSLCSLAIDPLARPPASSNPRPRQGFP